MKGNLAVKSSISMPEVTLSKLRKFAHAEEKSLSGVIQDAIRFYLASKEWESVQRSLAVRARKLSVDNEDDVDRLVHRLRK